MNNNETDKKQSAGLIEPGVSVDDKKQYRDLVWPENAQDAIALGQIAALRIYLCGRFLEKIRSLEQKTVAFMVLCCTDVGIDRAVAKGVIWQLQRKDVLPNGEIALRIHPEDQTLRRCYLSLTRYPRLLLNSIVHSQPDLTMEQAVFPNLLEPADKARKGARSLLVSCYAKIAAEYSDEMHVTPPALGKILEWGCVLAYRQGLTPALMSALHRYPLPVCQPLDRWRPMVRRSTSRVMPPPQLKRATVNITNPASRERCDMQPVSDDTSSEWRNGAETRVREFLKELETLTESRITVKTHGPVVTQMIDVALSKADEHGPQTSAEHTVLRWIRWRIEAGYANTASTHSTYVHHIYFRGLLDSDMSKDLSSWKEDDFEDMVEARIDTHELSDSSASQVIDTFKELFRYMTEVEGYLPVDLSDLDVNWSGGAGRFDVIGPIEFEESSSWSMSNGERDSLMHCAAMQIAYFGGLRPAELAKLSLKDITVGSEEMVITILKGKTGAARRKVLLHLVASSAALACVWDYVSRRRQEFGDSDLSEISLFGDQYDKRRFSRRALSLVMKEYIMAWYGPDFDTYHLRHSCATWLLVRLSLLRDRTLLDSLVDRGAEIFSVDSLKRLSKYLSRNRENLEHGLRETDYWQVAKFMGHLEPATTFVHYFHLYDVCQMAEVREIDRKEGNPALTQRAMKALLSGLRDAKDGKARKTRFVDDINQLLEGRIH